MSYEIPLIPEVPVALREAQQLGKLVPFVGAGVSRLAGCPDWGGLADGVLKCLVAGGKYSHGQLAQISHLTPRVKLSLAMSMQRDFGVDIDFVNLLHPESMETHANGRRIYAALSSLAHTFVTTNYDEWLDFNLPVGELAVTNADGDTGASTAPSRQRRVLYQSSELTAANLNSKGAVIHLHGSAKHPQSMILTTQQYIQHYANDRRVTLSDPENPVLTFLDFLFRQKTVLFVGYGMSELEILEHVMLKSQRALARGTEPRHFILQGFFSHEFELMLALRRYYRDCGIQLVPFLRDQQDYWQLCDVLEHFAKAIPASDLEILQEFAEMEALLGA